MTLSGALMVDGNEPAIGCEKCEAQKHAMKSSTFG
jgi:hypothetical protein